MRNYCVTKNFDFKLYERKKKIELCRTNHLSSCWICQSGRPRILRFFRSTDTEATIESPRFSTKQWPLNDLHWDSILFDCSHVLCMSRGGSHSYSRKAPSRIRIQEKPPHHCTNLAISSILPSVAPCTPGTAPLGPPELTLMEKNAGGPQI